jgi:hypothetical protein
VKGGDFSRTADQSVAYAGVGINQQQLAPAFGQCRRKV